MWRRVVTVVILLSVCSLERVTAELQQECLDQISRGRHCCSPSAFVKLNFKLRLGSVPEGCDPATYLDEGIRLEVQQPGHGWEPIRFYTATIDSRGANSLVHIESNGSYVSDETNTSFPLFHSDSTEPFDVSEYMCGAAYYTPGTQYRWLQEYNSSTGEGEKTWALGDITLTYHEQGMQCSASLSRYSFNEINGTKLSNSILIQPACDSVLSESLSLHFNQASKVDGYTQRGVILTPVWWNANCSQRPSDGCELSEECSPELVTDGICSRGSGMKCQCDFPQVARNDNMCYYASVGFEKMYYDSKEGQAVDVCVRVLNGTLDKNFSLLYTTTGGTGPTSGGSGTFTLSPSNQRFCFGVSDDDNEKDETECFTSSLTVVGGFNNAAYLSQDTATLCFVDTDVIDIQLNSNTVREGGKLVVEVSNNNNTDMRVRRRTQTFSGILDGYATTGEDFTGLGSTAHLGSGSSFPLIIPIKKDYIWEGDEVFMLTINVTSPVKKTNSRTITILDLNELQVGFSDEGYTVREDVGTITVCSTVHGNISSNANLKLSVTTIPESAREILDYRGVYSVIEFNSSVSGQCVQLGIIDDIGVEGSESLVMSISLVTETSNVVFTRRNVSVLIMDNDFLEVGLTSSMYTAFENSTHVMVCSEVKRGSLEFPVHLSMTVHSTDLQVSTAPLDILLVPAEEVVCKKILIEDDGIYEETEVLAVSLSLTQPLHSAINLSLDTADILIFNDDALTVGLVVNNTQSESSGAFEVCVEVLSGDLATSLSFHLNISHHGTAIEGVDYTSPQLEDVSLDDNLRRNCVSFIILDDEIYEGTEFFTVSLSGPSAPLLTISPNEYRINIVDNDNVDIGFVKSVYSTTEGNTSISICVEVEKGQLAVDISVAITSSSQGRSDLIIGQHHNAVPVCMTWLLIDDDVWEADVVEYLSLSSDVNLTGVNISTSSSTLVITDDDDVSVGIDQSEYHVREDVDMLSVCVRLAQGFELGSDLILQLQSIEDTAKGSKDYDDVHQMIILTPTVTTRCIALRILNDDFYEEGEQLTISLSIVNQTRVQVTPQTARVFIADDDRVEVGFQREQYSVQESHSNTSVCVELSGQLETSISFHIFTQSETATELTDYRPLSTLITFSEGVFLQCVDIQVVDDNILEQRESVLLHISSDTPRERINVLQHNATVMIIDDDNVTVGFEQNYTVVENAGEVSVCVTVLSGDLGQDLLLYFSTQNGTAYDMADFIGYQQHNITLTPDSNIVCVPVLIINDTLYEEKELFSVSLSLVDDIGSSVDITEGLATVTIDNDDEILVAFEKSYYFTSESAGHVDVCAFANGELGANLTLAVSATAETSTVASDYNITSSLNLTPNNIRSCVNFTIVNDDIVESVERIRISLGQIGTSDLLHISNKSLNIDITDDDVAVIGLQQSVTPDQTNSTIRHVEICAVTNSTLERVLELSLSTDITTNSERNLTTSHLVLKPNSTQECISFIITLKQVLVFYVATNESAAEIPKPNGTIVGEPSFDEIHNLLNGDNFNLKNIVDALGRIVESLIENGQTASYEFSQVFIDIVGEVLTKSNEVISEKIEDDNTVGADPGTSLLVTLDKFALQSYNSSFPAVESDNTKINVMKIVEKREKGDTVTGVSSPEGEEIEIMTAALTDFNVPVTVGSYYLQNVSGILPTSLSNISNSKLVTPVLSSALWCQDRMCQLNKTENVVRISLHHRTLKPNERPRCVFYNLSSNEWSENGCSVSNNSSSTNTICTCNHLTHFGVMLSPKNSVDKEHAYNLQLIGYVGISISLTCLLITIIIFISFRSLWSMRNYIHVNLCISLLVSQLLFVAGVDRVENQIVCQTIAVLLHYGFLVTFMWMLMEGVVLYVALVRVFVTKPRRYMIGFTITSYGVPLVYMALAVPLGFLLPHAPHYGGETCWLKYDTNFIWAMIAPVILIIMANVGFFFMAVYIIWKQQSRKKFSMNKLQKAKHWLKVSISLLVVMGISWIAGVITFHEALLFVSYIFTIIVAFQGAIIFLMFVVFSQQVRMTLKKSLVRNVIIKSDYLSDRFSEFTRSTQAGYSQSYSGVSSKSSTVHQGVQLGTFLASPSAFAKIQEDMTGTVSPSPPPTSLPSPSLPSTPYASSCNSPLPPTSQDTNHGCDVDVTDSDEKAPNSFTVIFVTNNDKDSGRGSPDSDTICTPPPDNTADGD